MVLVLTQIFHYHLDNHICMAGIFFFLFFTAEVVRWLNSYRGNTRKKEPVTTCDISRKLILKGFVSFAGSAWKHSSSLIIFLWEMLNIQKWILLLLEHLQDALISYGESVCENTHLQAEMPKLFGLVSIKLGREAEISELWSAHRSEGNGQLGGGEGLGAGPHCLSSPEGAKACTAVLGQTWRHMELHPESWGVRGAVRQSRGPGVGRWGSCEGGKEDISLQGTELHWFCLFHLAITHQELQGLEEIFQPHHSCHHLPCDVNNLGYWEVSLPVAGGGTMWS